MITKYKAGDKLYECAQQREGLRVTPIVREWLILAVTQDPTWLNTDETPLHVVTMRAEVKHRRGTDPVYRAASAEMVDIDVSDGLWWRTREEAEVKFATWAGARGTGS